ncbi:MAG: chromate efflux transporter [Cytophagales bacterium]|nr:MAG: chromate efflux transporter [Cytophagales bacterium]
MDKADKLFLKDIFIITINAFGGPQAHLALFFRYLVEKRKYLSESELTELIALCQMLPGPSSTQTLLAIAYKRRGFKLAMLTLLIWMLPAFLIITCIALLMVRLENALNIRNILNFTHFIQPMAVGFVGYAAIKIIQKLVNTKTGVLLMIAAAVATFLLRSPWTFPIVIIVGGLISALKYKKHEKLEKQKFVVSWRYFIVYATVFIGVASIGLLTKSSEISLPIRLFENFYRNGSLVFGGGQVLVPALYNEFVEFKKYLSSEEFLSGYALVQAVPGPVFAFSGYIGGLSMRHFGDGGIILGSFVASIGIYLPGAFILFFVLKFWEQLKLYRPVRASLEGINAVSAGMVVAAAFVMSEPIEMGLMNIITILSTFLALMFTKIPPPILIFLGIIGGIIFSN